MDNKICVYAIAKNEEQFVKRWVESVSSADKIIVLDTGSTDNTVSLLSSLGVEVHEKQYEHFRFDVARNDCLDLVPEEYNIRVSIDLDEIFAESNWADIIKENWDEDNPRIIYHYVWAHNDGGSNGLEFIINKIHGRDPYLRWEGAVHEHLTDIRTMDRHFDKFVDLTKKLTVHHYPDLSRDRTFYKELSKERIAEHPDDFQAIVLAGNEERVKGDPQEAIKLYDMVLNNPNLIEQMDAVDLAAVYYAKGECLKKAQRAPEAMASFASGIAINKFYRDNYYGLGTLLLENEMYEMGIGVLEEALVTTKRHYFWMEDNYTWTFAIYDALGFAYYSTGKIKEALGCAAKALSFEPTNEVLLKNYNTYLEKL